MMADILDAGVGTVDCDEQTRPWSAGQCDGHSDDQLADQPSHRRQSGQYTITNLVYNMSYCFVFSQHRMHSLHRC